VTPAKQPTVPPEAIGIDLMAAKRLTASMRDAGIEITSDVGAFESVCALAFAKHRQVIESLKVQPKAPPPAKEKA
jgi:hypothetical protein